MAVADVTQTTAASQPLLLAHSGVNYWWGSGVSGNYCSTPTNVANEITEDIEFIAKVNFQDSGNQDTIFIKSDAVAGTSYCYSFWKNGDYLALTYSNGGTVSLRVTTTSSARLSSVYTYGNDIWVKGNRNASNGEVKFYYGSDGTNWTQLGTTQSTTPQTIYNASIPLWVGDWANILFQFRGKIYRATISNSIGGTPVVDFNPATYNASTSQTAWTSSTGEVWTINTGTAATGYKGCVVSKTIVQSDGVDDGLVTSQAINLSTVFTLYGAVKGYNNDGGNGKSLFGKSNIDGNVFRNNAATLGAWIGVGGGAYPMAAATAANLNLVTFKRKVSNNTIQVNNGTIVNDTSSYAIVNSTIALHSVTTYGSSNSLFATGFVSSLEDDTTQKTALYNIIRLMNNNAF
jgi:hypothetical protein